MPPGAGPGAPAGQPGQPGLTGHPVSPGEPASSFDEHEDDASGDPFSEEPDNSGPGTDSNQ